MSTIASSPLSPSLPFATQNTTSATSTTTSASSSSQTSLSSLGSTFMALLVKELQNQDPTAPMDSTAMVGQMISLNQLDQIASINELLTNTLSGSSSGTSTASANTAAGIRSATAAASNAAAHASLLPLTMQGNGNAVSLPLL